MLPLREFVRVRSMCTWVMRLVRAKNTGRGRTPQKNEGPLQCFPQHLRKNPHPDYLWSELAIIVKTTQAKQPKVTVCMSFSGTVLPLPLFSIFCCNWGLASEVRHQRLMCISSSEASVCSSLTNCHLHYGVCVLTASSAVSSTAPEELGLQQGWQTARGTSVTYWTKIVFTQALREAQNPCCFYEILLLQRQRYYVGNKFPEIIVDSFWIMCL